MEARKTEDNLLKLAGIRDVADFYQTRFLTGGVLHATYFDALSRFDINLARTMWVYDNVRRGSSILDLGCGEGILAVLKRKEATLVGVDLSPELLGLARRNGYDEVYCADLTSLPFDDATFDYVVSLDVLGHVSFSEKPAVLKEIKRVLKPDGVTMHGIESLDRDLHQDYDSMSQEKLSKFVAIDGHIGLEDDDEIADRFRAVFQNVEARSRYALCLSVAEFLKQTDEYGVPYESDFIEYLRGLSFDERRAFDMAMGYVFAKISDLDVRLPKSGLYMLLKASDAPLGSFYNAHRDRRAILGSETGTEAEKIWLDRDSRASFDAGWYPANYLPPVARWMGRRAGVRFEAPPISVITLDLTTHIPDLKTKPLNLEVTLNGYRVAAFSLIEYGWLELSIEVPPVRESKGNGIFEFEIRADRTWQPSAISQTSKDDRKLSIAVCNFQAYATANVT
ncbi:MAG: class I SAM-dependent methyltransferase [Pyrinomonadaceae bacterium]